MNLSRTFRFRRFWSWSRIVLVILGVGIGVRLLMWSIYPPIWKLHAVFNPIQLPVFEYIRDFQGYKPLRMPFFDVFSAVFHMLFRDVLGHRSLSLFGVIISSISLPFMYGAVRRLFDRTVALFALLFYSFYPKFVVMSVRGFPEAAAVSFIAISLYALSRSITTNRKFWPLCSGLAALLAWLMYVPAVIYAILATGFILLFEFERVEWRWRALNVNPIISFSLPSAVIGIAYLAFGPIRRAQLMAGGTGAGIRPLFTHPEAYTTVEKIVWYLAYVYFDFWWHRDGFDDESGIRITLEKLQGFSGELFPFAIWGWIVLTGVLTLVAGFGVWKLYQKKSHRALFLLIWLLTFAGLHTLRNGGWSGAFQTRHVMPMIPAIAIAFGLGAAGLSNKIRQLVERDVEINHSEEMVSASIGTFLSLLFGLMLVTAAVHGTFTAENVQLSREDPIEVLETFVGPGDQVVVLHHTTYWSVIIYSNGAIRPKVLVDSVESQQWFEIRSVQAEIEVATSADLARYTGAYLFIAQPCGGLTERQQSFISQAQSMGSQVVYEDHMNRGAGKCQIDIFIIEI